MADIGRRKLLTVEAVFRAPWRELLLVTPWLIELSPTERRLMTDWWPEYPRVPSPRPTRVEIVRPDGAILRATCRFANAHINWIDHSSDASPGFKPPWVVKCGLVGVTADDVPPDSQLWYDADEAEP